jgi:hypothetical protein
MSALAGTRNLQRNRYAQFIARPRAPAPIFLDTNLGLNRV